MHGQNHIKFDLNCLLTQTSVQAFVPVCSRVATKVCGIRSRPLQCRSSRWPPPQLITTLAPPAVVPEWSSHFRPSLSLKWTCISATITILYFFLYRAHPLAPFTPSPSFTSLPSDMSSGIDTHEMNYRSLIPCLSSKRRFCQLSSAAFLKLFSSGDHFH